tara:strand:- start:104 stop:361 length:258 start_codon:yes stop_codon:yes gene_type:complete
MNTKKTKISSLVDDPKNTGSSEVQIGFLTNKIKILSDHFKNYKKDKHSSLGLVKAINKRKRLLNYLKKTNEKSYSNILEKLNLRK